MEMGSQHEINGKGKRWSEKWKWTSQRKGNALPQERRFDIFGIDLSHNIMTACKIIKYTNVPLCCGTKWYMVTGMEHGCIREKERKETEISRLPPRTRNKKKPNSETRTKKDERQESYHGRRFPDFRRPGKVGGGEGRGNLKSRSAKIKTMI